MNIDNFGAMPSTLDVCLYLGVLIVVYVLFQDKLGPVKEFITNFLRKAKPTRNTEVVAIDENVVADEIHSESELFFKLIRSWKLTKDLAEQYGANKAVEIADEMFPHLIPKDEDNVKRENPTYTS
tara:strand:+ start:1716 stop:2090 length:375 start_codon:yes stop_codon:yes gene_type:complete